MDYNDFIFNFKLESDVFDPFPQNFSLLMHDSIHNLLPNATFIYDDQTALFNEYRAFADGVKLEIEYGFREKEVLSVPYLINSAQVDEIGLKNQGVMAGKIQVNLIHKWINDLNLSASEGYQGRISDVLEELIQDDKKIFNSTEIGSSENDGIWYQSMISKMDFIKLLQNNAFSVNSPEAPWYAFINSGNNFYFTDYQSLMKQSSCASLTFTPLQSEFLAEDSINNIQLFSLDFAKYSKAINTEWNFIELDSFDVVSEEKNIIDKIPTGLAPFVYKSAGTTSYFNGGSWFADGDSFYEENSHGRLNSSAREVFVLEKVILDTFLHPEIRAGMTIDITLATQDSSGITDSLYYTGKWLVEDSVHKWDGEEAKGKTQLIISRNAVDVPSDYKIKDKLYKG